MTHLRQRMIEDMGIRTLATGALRFLYKVTLKRDWAVDEIPIPKLFRLPVILSREEAG
jgi:integrase/recombinase XerD